MDDMGEKGAEGLKTAIDKGASAVETVTGVDK